MKTKEVLVRVRRRKALPKFDKSSDDFHEWKNHDDLIIFLLGAVLIHELWTNLPDLSEWSERNEDAREEKDVWI